MVEELATSQYLNENISYIFLFKGDGESVPETPPNEMSLDNLKPVSVEKSKTSTRKSAKSNKGFSMQLEIDGMAVGLFVIGVITRYSILIMS